MSQVNISKILTQVEEIANNSANQAYLFKTTYDAPTKRIQIEITKKKTSKKTKQILGVKSSKTLIDVFSKDTSIKEKLSVLINLLNHQRFFGHQDWKQILKHHPDALSKLIQNPNSSLILLNQVLSMITKNHPTTLKVEITNENQAFLQVQEGDSQKIRKFMFSSSELKKLLQKLSNFSDDKKKREFVLIFFKNFALNNSNTYLQNLLSEIEVFHPMETEFEKILKQQHHEFTQAYINPIKSLLNVPEMPKEFILKCWTDEIHHLTNGLKSLDSLNFNFAFKKKVVSDRLIIETPFYIVEPNLKQKNNDNLSLQETALARTIKKSYGGLLYYLPSIIQTHQTLSFIREQNRRFLETYLNEKKAVRYKSLFPFDDYIERLNHPSINFELNELSFRDDLLACNLLNLTQITDQLKAIHLRIAHDCKVLVEEAEQTEPLDALTYYLLDVVRDLPNQNIQTYIDILRGKDLTYYQLDAYKSFSRYTSNSIQFRYKQAIDEQLLEQGPSGLTVTLRGLNFLRVTKTPILNQLLHFRTLSNFNDFVSRLQEGENPDMLLINLRKLTNFEADDIEHLLNLLNEANYLKLSKEVKYHLIQALAAIIPIKLRPLIELNIHLTEGETHTMLTQLLQCWVVDLGLD